MTFLTILGVIEILCSFRLVLEGKTGKDIPESSRLEFLEKISVNNFYLSDVEDNTSGKNVCCIYCKSAIDVFVVKVPLLERKNERIYFCTSKWKAIIALRF